MGNRMGLNNLVVSIKSSTPASGPSGLGMYDMAVQFNSDLDHLGKFFNACVSQRTLIVPNSVLLDSLDDPNGLFGNTIQVSLVVLVYGQLGKPQGSN
jgi:hypothetical protein